MERSEFVKFVNRQIDRMLDSVDDDTLVEEIFPDQQKSKFCSPDAFQEFLEEPMLRICLNTLNDSQGNELDLNKVLPKIAKVLSKHYQDKKITKTMTFADAFPPTEPIDLNHPGYWDELSELIVRELEKYGKPPLFHKRQDKVLRYDWEKET
jgi:hypothetical protein